MSSNYFIDHLYRYNLNLEKKRMSNLRKATFEAK